MKDLSKIETPDADSATIKPAVFEGADEYYLLTSEGEDLGAALGTVVLAAIAVLGLGVVAATLILR